MSTSAELTESQVSMIRELVFYPLAQGEAARICHENIRWISRYGGERQRSEGVRLLNRVIKRLM